MIASMTESLCARARQYRRDLFEKFVVTGQGHPGSALSMVDIAVTLYHGGFVRQDAGTGTLRDRVIVSKGHAAVVQYPILVALGVLPQEAWDQWGHGPSPLRVFGNRSMPGIDVTSGSLGHGVGIGAGMALAFQRAAVDTRVFVIVSEGELYEGSTWEAILLATHHRLTNLTIVVDCNNLIILGSPDACVALDPIADKLRGMSLQTHECDGHNYDQLTHALTQATGSEHTGPHAIIARTVKGKGLSMMEHQAKWHYWNPMTPDDIARCRQELA
jgi:transketolase